MAHSYLILLHLAYETIAVITRELMIAILSLTLYLLVLLSLSDVGPLIQYILVFSLIRILQIMFNDSVSLTVLSILAFSDDILHFVYPGFSTSFILIYLTLARPLFHRHIQSTIPEVVFMLPYAACAYAMSGMMDRAISMFVHLVHVYAL